MVLPPASHGPSVWLWLNWPGWRSFRAVYQHAPTGVLHNGSGTGVVRIEGAGDCIPNWPNLLMDLSRMAPEKFPPLHGRNMVN